MSTKPKIVTSEDTSIPRKRRFSGTIAYLVAAVAVLVLAYLLISNNGDTPPVFPTVTETLPSPDIMPPVTPVPATPPTPQTTTPPATAPVTP